MPTKIAWKRSTSPKAQSLPPKKTRLLQPVVSPLCSQEDIVVLGMDKCVQAPVTGKAMDHFQKFANEDPYQSLAVVTGLHQTGVYIIIYQYVPHKAVAEVSKIGNL